MIGTITNNFPEGYTPNPSQVKLLKNIDEAFAAGKKFVICNAPTGSGKSFISKTLGNAAEDAPDEFRELVTSYAAYKRGPSGYKYQEEMDETPAFFTFSKP